MDEDPVCCGATRPDARPSRDNEEVDATSTSPATPPATREDDRTRGMVRVPECTFTMGTDSDVGFPADGEGPPREVSVGPLFVDRYAVSNAQFLTFVRETEYTTDAERFGWSFVFEDFVAPEAEGRIMGNVDAAPWWVGVQGANWFHPDGPGRDIVDLERLKHPVTHVSWQDAVTYAEWAGKRLPTEAEWECVARGGLSQTRYPWGDELRPDGEHRCNIWQGDFPERNTGDDGYVGTAPVIEFEPNGYGLYNMSGNVWEWCRDWFSPDYHITDSYDPHDPTGPPEGSERVMRGGSHLCHRSWCNRYRVAARSKNTPRSSTGNIGFRCVIDAVEE